MSHALEAIGVIRSGFEERFGTPRQPGLAPSATAALHLQPPYDHADALRGIEAYSHVWLLFGFHALATRDWRSTVRPPRLGGNRRIGVFASRSPFRPNGLGLSVVRLEGLLEPPGPRGLRLADHDLVDGTPIYDIKPYLPYADRPAAAKAPPAFAEAPERLPVRFTAAAGRALEAAPPGFEALVRDTLALDPRPAYRRSEQRRSHGVRLAGHEVRWVVDEAGVEVSEILHAPR